MATELASAYVTLIPTLKGASKSIQAAVGGSTATAAGQSLGTGLLGGLRPTFGGVAKLIGGIMGGAAVKGGVARAMKLEQAEYKFKAMGINVEKAMASCTEAVTGTAYGLDAAATIASQLGTSGVKAGDQMTQALKSATGMAAMGGVELERVGLVFSKVAATGRLQGDELMQFTEMGVNASAALAKHLGKSQAEVREMISAGEIDFKTFSDAMYATFGDAAKGANDTFSGAMSNIGSAVSRLTAKFAAPALEGLRKVFVALIPAIDAVSALMDPVVKVFEKFVGWASDKAVKGLEAFTKAMQGSEGPLGALRRGISAILEGTFLGPMFDKAVKALIPFKNLIVEFGGAVMDKLPSLDEFKEKVKQMAEPLKKAADTFSSFGGGIMDALGGIDGKGAAVLGTFAGVMLAFGGPIKSAVGAVAGFGGKVGAVVSKLGGIGGIFATIGSKIRVFSSAITLCGGGLKGFMTVMSGPLRAALGAVISPMGLIVGAIAALGAAFVYLMATNSEFRENIMGLVASIGSSLAPIIAVLMGSFTSLAASLLPVITNLAAALVPVLGQVITVIFQVIDALAPIVTMIVSTIVPILTVLITTVVSVAAQILQAVLPVVSMILGVIQTAMPVISALIKAAMTAILAAVTVVWPVIQAVIATAMGVISNVIKVVTGIISGDWSKVWSGIKGIFSSVWNGIKAILRTSMNAVKSVVSAGISKVTSTVKKMPETIRNFFSGAGSWLVNAGKNIIQGLWNGISDAASWLWDKISGLGDGIINAAKRALGIKSPSRRFAEEVGKFIPAGVGMGIAQGMGTALKSVQGMGDELLSAVPQVSDLSPSGEITATVGYSAKGATASAGTSGDVYNVYMNGNKVNDDEEIAAAFTNMLRVMKRKGAMGNVYA